MLLFSIYWAANVTAHMISFHISALLLAPFLTGIVKFMLGMFGTNPTMGTVSGLQYTGFWLVLAMYIVLLYILSLKWDKMFTKIRYNLLTAAIYTIVFVVISALTSEYWLVTTVISIVTLVVAVALFLVNNYYWDRQSEKYDWE